MNETVDKTAVRAGALSRRAAVPADLRRNFAHRLAETGLAIVKDRSHPGHGVFRKPVQNVGHSARGNIRAPNRLVSIYHPIRDEPDTGPLFEALTRAGVPTALPVTVARGQPLRFLLWGPGDAVAAGNWGIPEPLASAPEVDPDILFVPLAAFDRHGFRLGYGAGFYDSSLASLRRRKPVLAVGVAFAVQEVDRVPTEAHDEKLDALITDREVLTFGQA